MFLVRAYKSHVKLYREIAKLSQNELAQKLGIARESVSRMENSRTIPSVKVALEVSRILEVPVDKLFTLRWNTKIIKIKRRMRSFVCEN